MSPNQARTHGLGKLEPLVRFVEQPEDPAPKEVGSKIDRHGLDSIWSAMALAAARSIRPEGSAAPLAPWALQAARQLVEDSGVTQKEAETRNLVLDLLGVLRREIQDRAFRLPDFDEPAVGTKEEATYAFLESVRAGEPDIADQRFQWIARDLTREQATDLLLSVALPKFIHRVESLIAPVESLSQLQWVGWEQAPLLLRSVVRMQATVTGPTDIYDQACHVVSARQLLRLAARRAPGAVALGEKDAPAFFRLATEWAEADGDGRLVVVASALATGQSVEDVADAIATGGTLLFLQEGLRGGSGGWTTTQADSLAAVLRSSHALRRMVKIATPGQRILGL
ncbi:MAG: hypothetical protein KC729_05505, partial [Candidatus Eisenbacteria bacterium]|nr:hypothetical protein [Candidatus Eisenbacteria bacterium]